LQEGRPFSEVVSKAKELGYTEPDPRDDLGGVDVARKALILARMLGMGLEMEDVQVTPLFPEALAALSVPEFMAALTSLDTSFADKVASAAAQGQVLR
jgi:homoserine dehydrogenase